MQVVEAVGELDRAGEKHFAVDLVHVRVVVPDAIFHAQHRTGAARERQRRQQHAGDDALGEALRRHGDDHRVDVAQRKSGRRRDMERARRGGAISSRPAAALDVAVACIARTFAWRDGTGTHLARAQATTRAWGARHANLARSHRPRRRGVP
ncbi:hypothetical protein LA521A_29080 [Lysobacter auxotrophicus]|uniref:Uncharacterized protein n=1 Tax=Lysobacter auxotrophicus TaxID=2992573 RepID=A0ABM8DGI8_9GAMM|nr:hypothetical protein [Lysobacter auxotrophicus]BDU17707.1 hypothetical protein LA521A_29080 [Lysobacter auxotrophicus]